MTNQDYLDIINANAKATGDMYGYTFPIATDNTFAAWSAAFYSSPMKIQNAFLTNLNNFIVKVGVKGVYKANNEFRKLYREPLGLTSDAGSYIEEVAVDRFVPLAYDIAPNPDKFFERKPPKVKVQIMHNVLRKKYEYSRNEALEAPAFDTLDSFKNFFDVCLERMYADMTEDDKEEIIAAINAVINGGNMKLRPFTRPTDSTTALAFSRDLDVLTNDLAFKRRRDSNLQHLSTKTAPEDSVLIIAGDVVATQNNYNLAWAFNKSYLELLNAGQMIKTDSEGLADKKVYAIYTDSDFFRIHDVKNFPRAETQIFGDTLDVKTWLHNWKQINFSYASNAIAYVDPSDIGVESVELKVKDGQTSVKAGDFLEMDLPVVKAAAGKLADAYVEYSITGNTSENTVIDKDSGTLYVAPDETGTITITGTSHLDDTKSGTVKITVN